VLTSYLLHGTQTLKTCPGFPGYCSESFPGQSCNVVCDFGRNNVPLCQDDGTWTDIPRCIEHDPGVDEQIPGTCPAIPGYCAQGFLNTRCRFDCTTGKDIDSLCSIDGTWEPYPTCDGDLRETRDGCDGCPGPAGKSRNRTAEAIISRNTASDRRVPKIIANNGERKTIPSFAGNINIGVIDAQKNRFNNQQRPGPAPRPTTTSAPRNFNNIPNSFSQQPQSPFRQQPRQQQQFQQQPQSPFRQQQQQPQRQPQTPAPAGGEQTLSLFEQIKQRINREKQLKNQIIQDQNQKERQQTQQQPQQQPQNFRQPQQQPQNFRQQQQQPQNFRQPQQSFQQPRQNVGSFGVFEAVDLSGPSPSPLPPSEPARSLGSRQTQNEDFFGVFQSVNLQ